jgi:hypothetical protein
MKQTVTRFEVHGLRLKEGLFGFGIGMDAQESLQSVRSNDLSQEKKVV